MKGKLLLCLSLLVFLAACTVNAPAGTPSPEPLPPNQIPTMVATSPSESPSPELPPLATETALPSLETAAPEPTATRAVPLEGKQVSANGIEFFLPAVVAQDAMGSVYDQAEVTADTPYWDRIPDYHLFTFSSYAQASSELDPQIQVWPVEAYLQANPGFSTTLETLKAALAQPDAEALAKADMPFPPIFNAGMQFSLREQPLNFKNGSGLRYLTFFSQAMTTVDGKYLLYTYQGLTADEKYYVSAILPVDLPALAALNARYSSEQERMADYKAYIDEVEKVLLEAPEDAFLPNMQALDAMMASLSLAPVVNAETVYTQDAYFHFGSIQLNSLLGTEWVENNQEPSLGDGSGMPMSSHPYLGGLFIKGYPLQGQFHEAQIITFELQEFLKIEPHAAEQVEALKAILADESLASADHKDLPFFPIFPAAQIFNAQPKLLHFKNGSGLRYLTTYAQSQMVLDNHNLFYTFQGISKDEKTYVIVILPVHAPILEEPTEQLDDPEAFYAIYDLYVDDIRYDLNHLSPEEFTPDLNLMDQMIETLRLW